MLSKPERQGRRTPFDFAKARRFLVHHLPHRLEHPQDDLHLAVSSVSSASLDGMDQQAGPSTARPVSVVNKRKIVDAVDALDDVFRAPVAKRTAIAKGKASVDSLLAKV